MVELSDELFTFMKEVELIRVDETRESFFKRSNHAQLLQLGKRKFSVDEYMKMIKIGFGLGSIALELWLNQTSGGPLFVGLSEFIMKSVSQLQDFGEETLLKMMEKSERKEKRNIELMKQGHMGEAIKSKGKSIGNDMALFFVSNMLLFNLDEEEDKDMKSWINTFKVMLVDFEKNGIGGQMEKLKNVCKSWSSTFGFDFG